MDQQAFLARARQAVHATQSPVPGITGRWQPLLEIANDRAARVARFCAELEATGGRAERVGVDALSPRVVETARGWNAQRVAVAGVLDDGLIAALRDAGIEIVEDAARADFGLSDVVCAIAETGTLMLASGAEEPRLATLLPPRYLAIASAEQIVPNFLGAVQVMRRRFGTDLPASITLVTGPSRTADIELSLTIGVHGPGQVLVLIVE